MKRTLESLNERLAGLTPEKRAFLEKLLREKGLDEAKLPLARSERPPDGSPLSYAQQRLWFLSQMEPDAASHNLPHAFGLRGELNAPALRDSLNEIVRRHEALRTTFAYTNGQPVQNVSPSAEIPLPLVDLSGLEPERSDEEVRRIIAEDAKRPFDLATGPLLRTMLLRRDEETHTLTFTVHHIAYDLWSVAVFVGELGALYESFCAGQPSPLPELTVQYSDFAAWQRRWMEGDALQEHVSFWEETLAGCPQVLDVPTDRPRPPVQTFRGARHHFVWSKKASEGLVALSRSEHTTLFITTLALFDVLLYRYTGQRDFMVGVPIANRNRPEIEGLIGFFVNTLAMRAELSGDPSFRQFLRRVRQMAVGAFEHQDLPFEMLVDELEPERDLSRTPLVQVMFTLQSAPPLTLSGLTVVPEAIDGGIVNFDLEVYLQERAGAIAGMLVYNQDLFDPETIARMADHFQVLAEAVVSDPDARVVDLPLLSEAERKELACDLNDTRTDFPRDAAIHRIFEEHARTRPDAPAVDYGDGVLTYGELDRRANVLAHRLRELGVGAETRVGILLERSSDMIAAMLGALKAGGAYVPLDPEHPIERLAYMVEDSGMSVLLTSRRLGERFTELAPAMVPVEEALAEGSDASRENLPPAALGDNIAYVIYTSGSTGRPKGVLVTHRAISRLVLETNYVDLAASDRVLQAANASFDAATFEIWGALLSGGRLVGVSKDVALSPKELAKEIDERGITTLFLTTALFNQTAREAPETFRGVRHVFFGGEACDPISIRKILSEGPPERLIHVYGPTESTTYATWFLVDQVAEGAVTVPIGRPIANTTAYVVDGELRLVPRGVVGELLIGGDGLARGYGGRPALTAEKFVPDPFGAEPGGRVYRTGDLVRMRGDGAIEFVGRVDHQVKLRGFRVELGEIEAGLTQHPSVREAIVVAREDAPGVKRLVAYLVPNDGAELGVKELRRFLGEKLPDYMVPAAFVTLESVPLTPHGKVDRGSLPAPDPVRPELEDAYQAPETALEKTLAAIWTSVLGVDRVGVHDNFFELGGDSILSIQIVARARKEGLSLSLKQMFRFQTIAELSAVVEQTEAPAAEPQVVLGDVPLTPIQRWFFESEPVDPHHFNHAVLLSFDATSFDPAGLEVAFRELLEHHDALRLRFPRGASGWEQIVSPPSSEAPLARVDLSEASETELAALVSRVASAVQQSLDLEHGPLLRAVHFDLGGSRPHRLLIVIHHLAVDGVSWRILLSDLETACRQIQSGKQVRLPPKTTSFKMWAERLVEHAASDAMARELPYWESRRPSPALPAEFEPVEDANLVRCTEHVSVALSAEQTRTLLQVVSQVYGTQINEVLLTALARGFARWTGEDRLWVDLEGHGREELFDGVDLSRTVGWFTSMFPVELDGSAGESPVSALERNKARLRELPQRGIGYGILRYLSPQGRALASQAHPKVSFNYLGQFDQTLSAKGIFFPAPEPAGPTRSLRAERPHWLEIGGRVAGGRLRMDFLYSRRIHRRETVETLARDFVSELTSIIERSLSPENLRPEASRFPLARLSDRELESAAAEVQFHPREGKQSRAIEDVYLLSPMQEGMLFHSLFSPGSGVYVTQVAIAIDGLDVSSLRRAWQRVIDRNPIFRTAFAWKGLPHPVQIVGHEVGVFWEELDWRHHPPGERETRLRNFLRLDQRRGFQLSRAPLSRAILIEIDDDRHFFVWSFHHILLDGWSIPPVLEEVFTFYASYVADVEVDLPKRPPFREYVAWLANRDLGRAEAFWRNELEGFTAPNPIPLAKPAQQALQQAEGYDSERVDMGSEILESLVALAKESKVTLNTLMQAVWALLLSRYSGDRDVVFGITVSGRPPEMANVGEILGLFINTIPLRVRVDPAERFVPWLKTIHQKLADIHEHEYTPLKEIQGFSEVPRNLPLFGSILIFENYPLNVSSKGASTNVRPLQMIDNTNYPLAVMVFPRDPLTIRFSYDQRHFERDTIVRMLGHFKTALQWIAARPEAPLSELPILSSTERRQVLVDWNQTNERYPRDARLPDLVEARARQTPDRVAVRSKDRRMTYRELSESSSRLAHLLADRGVGPEVLVGIAMERSIDMVVALLGILKAGGAYVPLDVGYPEERLRFMMKDSQLSALLTESSIAGRIPANDVPALVLDRLGDELSRQPVRPPSVRASADNLAYVIYTSGTTGKPKGVQISHRNLVNFLTAMQSKLEIDEADALVAVTTLSFDIAGLELYLPLLAGASTVIVDEEVASDARRLAEVLGSATVMQATPATWRMLVDADWPGSPKLKILCGGEALPAELGKRLAHRGNALWNLYGPTETTIWSAAYRADSGRDDFPIGRPIANTTLYVLDPSLNPVPAGVTGELYIGGEGVARGYLGRPDLTAERFVPDPFSEIAGRRLYRTGDRVRYRADGTLEFLGRVDHQVKVRGFRIELGEIESALERHPLVRQAAVTALEAGGREKRLAAYVVPEGDSGELVEKLRLYLHEKLPSYMVPTSFKVLEAMPLTPNGKIDRRTLPGIDSTRPDLDARFVAPRTPAEETLAEIWRQVLGLERIGAHDNFFLLGGDSILSIQIVSRANQAGLNVTPKDIFQHQTIAELAAVASAIEEGGAEPTESGELEPVVMVKDEPWRLEAEPSREFELAPFDRRQLDKLLRKKLMNKESK